MSSQSAGDGTLVNLYRNRIGEPSTGDEARGYWVFALGVILGLVGVFLFTQSSRAGSMRQWSIVLASAGLVLLLAGPLIRLPLRRMGTWLVYLGVIVCAAAIVWFVSAFPAQWNPQSGQPTIIALYAGGMLLMAVAGVFVPILTDRAELEARVSALQSELDAFREALRDSEADEADLVDVISDLRHALADTEADENDLARLVEDLRGGLADTEADEADLAARLRAIRSSQAQFELYEDKGDHWRWRLRHLNGNVIADSAQGYTRKHNAQKGMTSVRRNALGATNLLIEREEELPEEGTEDRFVYPEVVESQATYELYEDKGEQWRWRLRHDNGDIIADCGEGYASHRGAQDSIEGLRDYVGPADYLRADPTAFEVYIDAGAEWRWRLVHRNGNILADSGEGYSSRSGARRALNRIRDGVGEMEFEVYEDAGGDHRWRLRGGNNQIMADSGQGYASLSGAEDAVERVTEHAPEAAVLDIGRAVFEVFEDQGGDFRWRLRHRNGNILCDSGQGYSDRSGAWDGIESIKRNAPTADVEEESN